jgi:hypothetical protein
VQLSVIACDGGGCGSRGSPSCKGVSFCRVAKNNQQNEQPSSKTSGGKVSRHIGVLKIRNMWVSVFPRLVNRLLLLLES